jgi:hypothetical protein
VKCIDCGKPTSTGRSDGKHKPHQRCLPCETAKVLAGWSYPASQSWQAIKRAQKTHEVLQ